MLMLFESQGWFSVFYVAVMLVGQDLGAQSNHSHRHVGVTLWQNQILWAIQQRIAMLTVCTV
jgi:hypothetical protein